MLPSRGGQAARSAPDPEQDTFDRDHEQVRQFVQEQQWRGSILDYRKLIGGPLYNPNNGIMQNVTQMGALGRYGMGDRAVPTPSPEKPLLQPEAEFLRALSQPPENLPQRALRIPHADMGAQQRQPIHLNPPQQRNQPSKQVRFANPIFSTQSPHLPPHRNQNPEPRTQQPKRILRSVTPEFRPQRTLRSNSPEKQTAKNLPAYEVFQHIQKKAAQEALQSTRKRALQNAISERPVKRVRRESSPDNDTIYRAQRTLRSSSPEKRPAKNLPAYEVFQNIQKKAAQEALQSTRKRALQNAISERPAKRVRQESSPDNNQTYSSQATPVTMNRSNSEQLQALQEQFRIQSRPSPEDARRLMPPPPRPSHTHGRMPLPPLNRPSNAMVPANGQPNQYMSPSRDQSGYHVFRANDQQNRHLMSPSNRSGQHMLSPNNQSGHPMPSPNNRSGHAMSPSHNQLHHRMLQANDRSVHRMIQASNQLNHNISPYSNRPSPSMVPSNNQLNQYMLQAGNRANQHMPPSNNGSGHPMVPSNYRSTPHAMQASNRSGQHHMHQANNQPNHNISPYSNRPSHPMVPSGNQQNQNMIQASNRADHHMSPSNNCSGHRIAFSSNQPNRRLLPSKNMATYRTSLKKPSRPSNASRQPASKPISEMVLHRTQNPKITKQNYHMQHRHQPGYAQEAQKRAHLAEQQARALQQLQQRRRRLEKVVVENAVRRKGMLKGVHLVDMEYVVTGGLSATHPAFPTSRQIVVAAERDVPAQSVEDLIDLTGEDEVAGLSKGRVVERDVARGKDEDTATLAEAKVVDDADSLYDEPAPMDDAADEDTDSLFNEPTPVDRIIDVEAYNPEAVALDSHVPEEAVVDEPAPVDRAIDVEACNREAVDDLSPMNSDMPEGAVIDEDGYIRAPEPESFTEERADLEWMLQEVEEKYSEGVPD